MNARLAAAFAGLAAGAAYAAVLEIDLRLTGNNVDDLIVLGRPFTRDAAKARSVGAVFHAFNSVALAGLYVAIEPHFPGPPIIKGVVFANVENLILYPITLFQDFHPAVRQGKVDSYLTWLSFWQSVPRHVAYGAVLGLVYDWLEKWDADMRCNEISRDMSCRSTAVRALLACDRLFASFARLFPLSAQNQSAMVAQARN